MDGGSRSTVAERDRHDEATTALEELSRVRLRPSQRSRHGQVIPSQATGTIVEVLGDGQAYVVEVAEPISALVTVEARHVVPIDVPDR